MCCGEESIGAEGARRSRSNITDLPAATAKSGGDLSTLVPCPPFDPPLLPVLLPGQTLLLLLLPLLEAVTHHFPFPGAKFVFTIFLLHDPLNPLSPILLLLLQGLIKRLLPAATATYTKPFAVAVSGSFFIIHHHPPREEMPTVLQGGPTYNSGCLSTTDRSVNIIVSGSL